MSGTISPVKTDSFLERLRDAFDDFPRSELPRDVRFAEILEAVPGLARANNLALLNVAARCLEPGECYVEVGTYHGSSLIAAMFESDADFVALDNWSLGDGSREQLDRNLARFDLAGRPDADRGRRVRHAPLRRARGHVASASTTTTTVTSTSSSSTACA